MLAWSGTVVSGESRNVVEAATRMGETRRRNRTAGQEALTVHRVNALDGEVQARCKRGQGTRAGRRSNEPQRRHHDVCGAVAVVTLGLQHDPSPARARRSFVGG